MKPFKTYAYIYSLNKGKFDSTELDEVEIAKLPEKVKRMTEDMTGGPQTANWY